MHDHWGCMGPCLCVLVDEECVWSADMSLVMWYSGLEAVVSGTVCRGCGAVWVSRAYRYISLFWRFVESWSGVVVSPVHYAALGTSYQQSVRSRRGQDWSTGGFLTGTRLSYSG